MTEVFEAEAESFRVLGVGPGASIEEIRLAFRKQAMIHHPDRNPGNTAAETRFRELLSAYQVALRSIERRAKQTALNSESVEARNGRSRRASGRRPVYRSTTSFHRFLRRSLLLIAFTVGAVFLMLVILWANTTTDWIPGCCSQYLN